MYHQITAAHQWIYQTLRGIMRPAVIIGVILISVLLGASGSTRGLSALLVLMLGAIGLSILLRWPVLGIFFLIPLSINVPLALRGGISTSILWSLVIIGLWIMDMLIHQKKFRFVSSNTLLPATVFLASAIISFLVGQIPWYPLIQQAPISAQVGGFLVFVLSIGVFLLIANQVRDIRWLQTFVWTFILIGSVYMLGRLVPPIGNIFRPLFQPGATTGSIFWIWMVVLAFSQAYLNDDLPRWSRIALFALVLGTLYIAIFRSEDWKSGYIPPIAGIAAIIALRHKHQILFLAPIAAFIAIYVTNEAIATEDYSYSTRLVAWEIVIQIAKANPILGLGFANYYWYTPLFPILGYAISFNSHSQFVDIIAQTGFVGLLIYFWFFWSIGRLGIELHTKVSEGFSRAYVYGAIGGAAGMLVASLFVDWVLPFVYNIGLTGFRSSILGWMFLGGLVSIEQIMKRSTNIEPT